jgi:NAD(P)-dependent dehydrogenase (short-subunit alcohol dehydrogenase family)
MPTCLITGANRGIGLEFARQYAADGWSVIGTCRRPELALALRRIEGDVRIEPLDVTDFAQIERLARTLDGIPIDLLLNNAGIYGPRVMPYDSVDYAAWAEVMRVNAMSPLKVSAVFTRNVAWSRRKLIVTLTSSMGSIGDNASGGAYVYRSSKAALNAVMRSLSIDLRPKEITVVVVHPGWVRTDMGGSGAKLDPFESVAGMRGLFDRLTPDDSGRFLDYAGRELSW